MNPPQTPSPDWLVFGSEKPPAPLLPLRAGPLTLLYDQTSGFVRRICLGDREVLRGIYAAVRDRNWGTVPGTLRETTRQIVGTPSASVVSNNLETILPLPKGEGGGEISPNPNSRLEPLNLSEIAAVSQALASTLPLPKGEGGG